MGLYDTIWIACPNCGLTTDAQSKSGSCELLEYRLADAPMQVLLDVNRHAPFECERCHTWFAVEIRHSGHDMIVYTVKVEYCACCGKSPWPRCFCVVGHDTMCVTCRKCDKCCECTGGPEHDPRKRPFDNRVGGDKDLAKALWRSRTEEGVDE